MTYTASLAEWKIHQELYHRLTPEHMDVIPEDDVGEMDRVTLISTTLDMASGEEHRSLWPAKSYLVAFLYATWLEDAYGGSWKEYLDDTELLYGNDPYFVPYSDEPEFYDLLHVHCVTTYESPVNKDIRKYFELEMLGEDD